MVAELRRSRPGLSPTSGGDVNWHLFSPVIYVSHTAVVVWCREVLQKLVFDQVLHLSEAV